MSELNVTPGSSAIAAALSAPSNASRSADPSAGGADENSASPFAAVLQNQMSQSGNTTDTVARGNDGDQSVAMTDGTEITIPTDILALLTPLLAGAGAGKAHITQTIAEPAAVTDDPLAQSPANANLLGQLFAGIASTRPGNTLVESAPEGVTSVAGADDLAAAAAAPSIAPMAIPFVAAAPVSSEALSLPASTPQSSRQSLTAILAEQLPALAKNPVESGKIELAGEARGGEDSFASWLNAAAGDLPPPTANIDTATQAARIAAAAPAAGATGAAMTTPVGARGWDGELGEKIVWMAARQESRAELVLNPPHLGRVEVTLSMNGDQASAVFVSASPLVREALENALPRLREAMQEAGITLGQAQVGAESFRQQAGNGNNGDNFRFGGGGASQPGLTEGSTLVASGNSVAPWTRQGSGLVDTFA